MVNFRMAQDQTRRTFLRTAPLAAAVSLPLAEQFLFASGTALGGGQAATPEPFQLFTSGKLAFTSGANDGLAVEVKTHRVASDGVHIELWQQMPEPIEAGDSFTVTAGCDKRFATCRDRFANAVNFRGFPHIPGNDFVISYPVPGEPGNDGSSLTN